MLLIKKTLTQPLPEGERLRFHPKIKKAVLIEERLLIV